VMRDAWTRGQEVSVHGWIYALRDGRLRDLHVSAASTEEVALRYEVAVRATAPGGLPQLATGSRPR